VSAGFEAAGEPLLWYGSRYRGILPEVDEA